MRDFEKLALDKLAYLETRIKKLESKKQVNFSEIEFGFDQLLGESIEKSCLFEIVCDEAISVNISGVLSCNAQFTAFLDNVSFAQTQLTAGEFSVNRELKVKSGEKILKIVLLSNQSSTLSNLKIVVKGYVKKMPLKYSFSVANFNNYSLVANSDGKTVEVLRYNGALSKRFQEDAEQSCISKSGDSAVLCVLNNKTLFVKKLDFYGDGIGDFVEIDGGITSISGSNGNTLFCVYAIKNGVVGRYDLSHDLSFSFTSIGFRAEKISSSPDVYRSCIITDFNGNSKLIVQE